MINLENNKLKAIEAYMAIGAYVFMTLPNTKHNSENGGYHNSFNSLDELKKWLDEHPQYQQGNIGIDLHRSPLLVVDVDQHSKNGLKSLKQYLQAKNVDATTISDTYLEKTPSGGWHIFYKNAGHLQQTRSINVIDGVDVLNSGGVVVSPSAINNQQYQAATELNALQEKPEWVNQFGQSQSNSHYSGKSAKYSLKERWNMVIHGFNTGERNEQATSLIGWLLASRLEPTQALEVAQSVNSLSAEPLPQRELENVYMSVLKREIGKAKRLEGNSD